jgi:2',3'-cyclic-nucleotide 2'-phosphodiesterase (5'-nucleotidase family)
LISLTLTLVSSVLYAGKPVLEGESRAPVNTTIVSEGNAKRRVLSGDFPSLILFYGGEQHGSMDTCGCGKTPRGGFPRTSRIVGLTKDRNPDTPVLLVNIGGWLDDTIGLDGSLRSDVQLANEWMMRGLQSSGWDAINIGYQDLPYLDSLTEFPEAALSGNLEGLGGVGTPAPFLIREFDGLKVGITAVSAAGLTFIVPKNYRFQDPVESLKASLPRLNERADVVIVLGYGLGRQANEVAKLEGIDVLVEGDRFHSNFGTQWVGDTLWVRSRYETQVLGELRLWLEDGAMVRGLERRISLDAQVAPDPTLQALVEEAAASLAGAQRAPKTPDTP